MIHVCIMVYIKLVKIRGYSVQVNIASQSKASGAHTLYDLRLLLHYYFFFNYRPSNR